MQVPHNSTCSQLLGDRDPGGKTSIISATRAPARTSPRTTATIGGDFCAQGSSLGPRPWKGSGSFWDIAGEPWGPGLCGGTSQTVSSQAAAQWPGDRVCLPGCAERLSRGGLQTWFRRKQKVSPSARQLFTQVPWRFAAAAFSPSHTPPWDLWAQRGPPGTQRETLRHCTPRF